MPNSHPHPGPDQMTEKPDMSEEEKLAIAIDSNTHAQLLLHGELKNQKRWRWAVIVMVSFGLLFGAVDVAQTIVLFVRQGDVKEAAQEAASAARDAAVVADFVRELKAESDAEEGQPTINREYLEQNLIPLISTLTAQEVIRTLQDMGVIVQ